MTWSPSASPLEITQSLPTADDGLDALLRDLAVRAHDQHERTLSIALHRELRHTEAFVERADR